MKFLLPTLIVALCSLCTVSAQEYLGVTITNPESKNHVSKEQLLKGKRVDKQTEDTDWTDGYFLSRVIAFDDYFSEIEENIEVEV